MVICIACVIPYIYIPKGLILTYMILLNTIWSTSIPMKWLLYKNIVHYSPMIIWYLQLAIWDTCTHKSKHKKLWSRYVWPYMHKGYDIQGAYNAHVVLLKDLMGINHNPTRTFHMILIVSYSYILKPIHHIDPW